MKKWLMALVLGIGVLAMFGCGGDNKQPAESSNVLKIGTNATFVPFEFSDKDEALTGFDIELIKEITAVMGVEPDFHNISFDGLIPALETGQIDVAISGMTITEARKEKVEFSFPYYESGLGVLVTNDSNISGWDDLEGTKVAVQLGTTGAEKAEEITNVELRTFDHNSEALLELKNGGVDAVIADLPVLQYYLSTEKDANATLITIESDEPEYFGIAIKKGNTDLKDKVNSALKELKENGKLDELYEKYFYQKAPVMPE